MVITKNSIDTTPVKTASKPALASPNKNVRNKPAWASGSPVKKNNLNQDLKQTVISPENKKTDLE